MSYEIVYGRQFIKTNKGIIPLVLSGANNCTELINGRERLERNWGFFYDNDVCEISEKELMDMVHRYHDRPDDEQYRCFMRNGKWVYDKECIRFYQNGIKYAKTIEEIVALKPEASLSCYIYCWIYGSDNAIKRNYPALQENDIRTTEALSNWIAKAKAEEKRLKSLPEKAEVFFCIKFPGREPLNIERASAI